MCLMQSRILLQGEFNQVDLDYFFKAEGEDENARFVNKQTFKIG